MLGVVIIDDEQVICDLIRSLVHWDQQGLTFLGAAHDGFSAMELIQEKKPDIGVIDIRIPGMDGIEVIEKARKVSPGTRFIVVSGYREFDYARQACSLYVSEYLVKPIDEDELNAALGKICRERALEQAGREEQEKLAQQIKDQRKYILQTAVRDMQKGTFAWSGQQPFSFQGLPFSHKHRQQGI